MQKPIFKFPSPAQCYLIYLLCFTYFKKDSLKKQILMLPWLGFLPNLIFWYFYNFRAFLIKAFPIFNKNIKELRCVKIRNLMVFVSTILHVWFRSKLDFRKLWTLLIRSSVNRSTFFCVKLVLFPETWVIVPSFISKRKIFRHS